MVATEDATQDIIVVTLVSVSADTEMARRHSRRRRGNFYKRVKGIINQDAEKKIFTLDSAELAISADLGAVS